MEADLDTHHIEGIARHGATAFSVPLVSHIESNLYVGGCLGGVPLPSQIEHVVSLYSSEAYRLHDRVRSVLTVRIDDGVELPPERFLWTIASHAHKACSLGPTLVHCQAGLNRSGLIAGLALVLHGRTGRQALDLIREKRSPANLCNPVFEAFLLEQGA